MKHMFRSALLAIVVCVAAFSLCACACSSSASSKAASSKPATTDSASSSKATSSSSAESSSSSASSSTSSSGASSASSSSGVSRAEQPVAYPTGWLIASAEGVTAGVAVSVLHLPDLDIVAHRNGVEVPAHEREELRAGWPSPGEGEAIVQYGGQTMCVNADLLLVNMPDLLPDAVYDIVYAYAATSDCLGQGIPEVTGEHIAGYAYGKQDNEYLGKDEFAVPCAYRTFLKARRAADELENSGYRLLVYDVYRPMTTQQFLSDAFTAAYESNGTIQSGLGGWGLTWYVADGPSGHNFGTDLDVGLCDAQGSPLPMPSAFDAFDSTGHLTSSPIDSGSITPAEYCDAVSSNEACLALHRAFVDAGFSEIASEWWHFGDNEAEAANREVVGASGLDFMALM